jgi:hypothetical protein
MLLISNSRRVASRLRGEGGPPAPEKKIGLGDLLFFPSTDSEPPGHAPARERGEEAGGGGVPGTAGTLINS